MLDVLIIGAGLSGIGAARHLQKRCPNKHWRIWEARSAIGGTDHTIAAPQKRGTEGSNEVVVVIHDQASLHCV